MAAEVARILMQMSQKIARLTAKLAWYVSQHGPQLQKSQPKSPIPLGVPTWDAVDSSEHLNLIVHTKVSSDIDIVTQGRSFVCIVQLSLSTYLPYINHVVFLSISWFWSHKQTIPPFNKLFIFLLHKLHCHISRSIYFLLLPLCSSQTEDPICLD